MINLTVIPHNKTNLNNNIDQQPGSSFNILTLIHISLISMVAVHLFYFIYMLIKHNCCRTNTVLNQPEKPNNMRKINDECSICLESLKYEVQLLCSHSYCANCIIDYGKQRFDYYNIQCPICRRESKLMFAQFERDEQNKELYDQILTYNHEITSNYSTSFCFCLDMFRFSLYYLRQVSNFNNSRYARQRKIIIAIFLAVLIIVLYPLTLDFTSIGELIEDICFYLFLIIFVGEYFYRMFRRQTNAEFEHINSNHNSNSQANNSQINNSVILEENVNNNNFQNNNNTQRV